MTKLVHHSHNLILPKEPIPVVKLICFQSDTGAKSPFFNWSINISFNLSELALSILSFAKNRTF
jgi:hypothetical protein